MVTTSLPASELLQTALWRRAESAGRPILQSFGSGKAAVHSPYSGCNAFATQNQKLIMQCVAALLELYPIENRKTILSRPSGHLKSCDLHVTSLQPQRCRHFRLRTTARSTGHRTNDIAMSMDASAPQRIEILEGSQLQERPDSTNEMFLYTHMLCPYAQTVLLTLLCKVRNAGALLLSKSVDDLPKPRDHAAGCASSGGTY